MPLILDCAAARILTERGFDVGLAGCVPMNKPGSEAFPDGRAMPVDTDGRFYRLTPAEGAACDSRYPDGSPAVYRYDRKDGGRVIVYAFDFDTVSPASAMIRNYCRQEQLLRLLSERIVEVRKEPGAYLITRKTADGLAVGIWNFGSDMLYPEEIRLDGEYRAILPIGGAGNTEPELNGDTVTLGDMIPPYCFTGFAVKK